MDASREVIMSLPAQIVRLSASLAALWDTELPVVPRAAEPRRLHRHRDFPRLLSHHFGLIPMVRGEEMLLLEVKVEVEEVEVLVGEAEGRQDQVRVEDHLLQDRLGLGMIAARVRDTEDQHYPHRPACFR